MTARTVPPGLAPLLELLELEQPTLLTAAQVEEYSRQAGIGWPPDLVVRRLRERGWLLPLATKGVWEFAPAARAGAFGSGDPLIEFRAVLARTPAAPYAAAAESAAYLLGLASHRPHPECIGAPAGDRLPKSLSGFRLVRWEPRVPLQTRERLPVWSVATLIAFMATRPSGYQDWPNAGEWLQQAVKDVNAEDIVRELNDRSRAAWARTAYLLKRGGAGEAAEALIATAPSGEGPYYLGTRSVRGRHDAAFDVIDSTGFEVRDA